MDFSGKFDSGKNLWKIWGVEEPKILEKPKIFRGKFFELEFEMCENLRPGIINKHPKTPKNPTETPEKRPRPEALYSPKTRPLASSTSRTKPDNSYIVVYTYT